MLVLFKYTGMDNPIVNDKQTPEKLSSEEFRKGAIDLEELMKSTGEAMVGNNEMCPLKHSFSEGIYVREIFIPKGMLLTGRIHKHEHPNFLMKGKVLVVTENKGREVLEAPLSMISKAGTKRVLYAVTDLVWITVHHNPTNTQDIEKLEKMVVVDTYEQYNGYLEDQKKQLDDQKKPLNRLKKYIIKKILL